MRTFICTWAVIATTSLLFPCIAAATEPAGEALPPEIIPTDQAPAIDDNAPAAADPAPAGAGSAPAGDGLAPAPTDGMSAPGGQRFKPAPSRGIQPTVSRLPAYWQCQDDLTSRLVVTFLDTAKPQAVLERGGKKVITTLQRSASGAKYMAPGGILFWDRGHEATLQWGSPNATSCTPLGG